MRLSSILLILHSLCLIVAQGISSPCPENCGNVTIPYPFGIIGSRCSYNASFSVTCRHDTNPPKPFLSIIDLEILEISFYPNTIRVNQSVSPLNCSSEDKIILGKSIVGSPFSFSDYNYLAVVGCNNEVLLNWDSHNDSSSIGCRPICGYTTVGCNGVNCCPITIPPRLQEFVIHYKTSEQGNGDGVCGLAFLADYAWLRSDYRNYTSFRNHTNPLDMSLQYVPVRLEFEYIDKSVQTLLGVTCMNATFSYSPTLDGNNYHQFNTTYCYCKDGFKGDPGQPGSSGCQDIDECSNTTLNNCTTGTKCINAPGSFACHPDDNNKMKAIIAGISSGTGALLLLSGAWMSSKVIRKRIKANRRKKFFMRNGGSLLEQYLSSSDGGVEKIKLFNSKELALATDRYNENRILGHGGQGTVYKGMLPDGRIVAVKKSKRVDEADVEVFVNEVVILSQINHRNIVKLLGCCLETEVPLLVYEFIPNGTLFQHIHDQNDEFPLSWKMRLIIAAEVAGALSYLHNAASISIYHRDIKSTNILLDDKYRAKLSDFGTSRSIGIDQTHLTTRVLGTFGYLDPEYFQSGQFTEKSDVYSFGVVMVELLTGEKAISAVRAEAGKSLATHFLHSMEENHLFDILDPKVLEDGLKEEIVAVAKLARRCLNLESKRRPTMKEVTAELVGIQMMKEGSVLQSNLEDIEFNSVELSDFYDFASSSDNTNLNVITAESSESPLLFGK